MKTFIASFVLLFVAGVASDELSASASIRADGERMSANAQAQLTKIESELFLSVQASIDRIRNANSKVKNSLLTMLNALGTSGKEFAAEVNLFYAGSDESLVQQGQISISNARSAFGSIEMQFKSLIETNIGSVAYPADQYSGVAKCWADNKAAAESLVNSTAQQLQASVRVLSNSISTSSKSAVVKLMQIFLTNQAAVVKTCVGNVKDCSLNYVSLILSL